MKSTRILLLLVLAWVASAAAEVRKVGEGEEMPKDGFAGYEDFQQWASGSSFGGGRAFRLSIGGRNVYCSDRRFTSGIATSELAFFTDSDDGRIRSFLIVPTQSKEHRVTAEADQIVVRCFDPAKKEWPVAMMLSPWMLPGSTTPAQEPGFTK